MNHDYHLTDAAYKNQTTEPFDTFPSSFHRRADKEVSNNVESLCKKYSREFEEIQVGVCRNVACLLQACLIAKV
jgi:hypothetical protein